jgi:hypothetical protein
MLAELRGLTNKSDTFLPTSGGLQETSSAAPGTSTEQNTNPPGSVTNESKQPENKDSEPVWDEKQLELPYDKQPIKNRVVSVGNMDDVASSTVPSSGLGLTLESWRDSNEASKDADGLFEQSTRERGSRSREQYSTQRGKYHPSEGSDEYRGDIMDDNRSREFGDRDGRLRGERDTDRSERQRGANTAGNTNSREKLAGRRDDYGRRPSGRGRGPDRCAFFLSANMYVCLCYGRVHFWCVRSRYLVLRSTCASGSCACLCIYSCQDAGLVCSIHT